VAKLHGRSVLECKHPVGASLLAINQAKAIASKLVPTKA